MTDVNGNKMKSIVLIDKELKLADELLKEEGVFVEVLICDKVGIEEFKNKPYKEKVNKLILDRDFDQLDKSFAWSIDGINKARGVQERVETSVRRFSDDMNEIKYLYYKNLSFWQSLYEKKSIAAVICNNTIHGMYFDGIPVYLAVEYGIPAYSVEPFTVGTMTVFNHTFMKCERYRDKRDVISSIRDVSDSIINDNGENGDVGCWGGHRRLLYYIYKRTGWHFIDFFRSIMIGGIDVREPSAGTGFYSTYRERNYSYKKYRKLLKTLKRIERKYSFDNTNYVLYFLQLEPEGHNSNYMIDSRLFIIHELAKYLPDGWKLIVKEHPYQLRYNTKRYYYYLSHCENFKSAWYYKTISNMENVILIDTNTDSHDLVCKARAIASEGGSVLIEALENGKNIILLDRIHPLNNYDKVFKVNQSTDIKEIMKKLERNVEPDYSDVETFLDSYFSRDIADVGALLQKEIIGVS